MAVILKFESIVWCISFSSCVLGLTRFFGGEIRLLRFLRNTFLLGLFLLSFFDMNSNYFFNFARISNYTNWPVLILTDRDNYPILSKQIHFLRPPLDCLVNNCGTISAVHSAVELRIKYVNLVLILFCVKVDVRLKEFEPEQDQLII